MSKKEIRQLYLVVKAAILALALVLFISGLQSLETGCKAGTLLFLWLSGVLTWVFVTLTE